MELPDFINFILKISWATTQLKSIILEEPEKTLSIRIPLHVMISMPPGSTKSTLLEEIKSKTGGEIHQHLTRPALVGSVDRQTKQFMIGAGWQARSNFLMLDEVSWESKQLFEPFLSLLEQNTYCKKVATWISQAKNNPEEVAEDERDKLFWTTDSSGKITMRTKFALVLATMYDFNLKNLVMKALVERSIPIRLIPDKEMIQKIALGSSIFKFERFEPVETHVIITNPEYMQLFNFCSSAISRNCFSHGLPENIGFQIFLRTLGDICRVYAITRQFNELIFNILIDLKFKAFLKTTNFKQYYN